MTEENLIRIIVKEIEEKPQLTIRGGETLNPIVEALFAVFREQLTDEEIMKMVNSEKDIRKVLATDAIIDYIPQEKRDEFKRKISSLHNYNDIINMAALYLAESKRISNGEILKPVSDFEKQKYFLRALKKADPSEVYVKESSAENLEKRAGKIRNRGIRRKVFAGILLVAMGFGAYKIFSSIGKKEIPVSEINSDSASRLENRIIQSGTGYSIPGGFTSYEISYSEFKNSPEIMKKMSDIEKKEDMNQLTLVFKGKEIDRIKYIYRDTSKNK